MNRWETNRWVIKDDEGTPLAWIALIGTQYLLGIIGGPQAWYDSLTLAMNAGEVQLRNDAIVRGAA